MSKLNYLRRVNEKFYSYFDKNTKMLFTMRYGDRGVYGSGKAWYLSVTYGDDRQTIATFTVKDDGHKCYTNDHLGKLWNTCDAIVSADEMVWRMVK